jgi:hypothetical protein
MTATVITAIVGIVSSLVIVTYNKYKERAESNRQRQIPVYQKILEDTRPVIDALVNLKPLPSMSKLTQRVAISASTDVLIAYLVFRGDCLRKSEGDDAVTTKKLTKDFSDMVMAIREDLGYTEKRQLTPELQNQIGASILRDLNEAKFAEA